MLSPGISICSLQESRQVISFDSKHNTFSLSLSLPLPLLCNFHDLFPLYMAHLHHFLCLKKPPSLPSSYLYATEPADNFRGTLVFQRPRNHARFFPSSSSSPSPFSHVSRVSTVPVEYPSDKPIPHHDLLREISRLELLKSTLSSLDNLEDKVKVLDKDPRVVNFFPPAKNGFFSGAVVSTIKLGFYELYLLKCLVAAGQEHVLHSDSSWIDLNSRNEGDLNGFESHKSFLKSAFYVLLGMIEKWDLSDNLGRKQERWSEDDEAWEDGDIAMLWKLLRTLEEMEKFYDCIGGIIGYQIIVLELILPSKSDIQAMDWSPYVDDSKRSESKNFYVPHGLDLSENTEYAAQAALWGIEGLPELGEIYPLGGSGDRLGLVDSETGECLPAAMLPYCGRTLLEGLIRDLQAREFLYFKLYGKQCITPLAIMTSSAKNNHKRINALCSRNKWFGRGRKNFQLFEQPVVPAVGGDGRWLINKPFSPVCKPGGHGVIWKLAYDKGIFQWFHDHGRKGATVRQISNVVAATDLTLLALAGMGLHYGKKLGFASCKRNFGATEGINVLVEQKKADGQWAYGLSCIEYTEFEKYGITDAPMSDDGLQAQFPANTNILYIDLAAAEMVGSSRNRASLPGMVLNLKKPIVYVNHHGMRHSVHGGRLECTMQNIADYFLNTYTNRCYDDVEEKLDTYIVFNERKRVTSSAKRKRRHSDKSLHQTPDGSLLDIMRNAYDLLSQCNIKIPKVEDHSHYFHLGPPFLILLHPSLGPLWEVTRQKFNGGYISEGSELQIEVSEFLWKDVQLDGSLIVIAENIMGSSRIGDSDEPTLQYGLRCGRCKLQNVKVLNKGIDWNCTKNVYWKHDVQRFETLKILLRGNAEFEASDVVLEGNHIFEVPDGFKLHVTNGCTGLSIKLDPIKEEMMDSGSWFWKYKLKSPHIQLEMVELQCV